MSSLAKTITAILLWSLILGVAYAFWADSRKKAAERDAAIVKVPKDDAELMVAKYGWPDQDSETNESGRLLRTMTFRSENVKAGFFCNAGSDAGVVSRCNRRWVWVAFAKVDQPKQLSVAEAEEALRDRIRAEAPTAILEGVRVRSEVDAQKRKTWAADRLAQIEEWKRKGLVHLFEVRETAAELQVRPSFYSNSIQAKQGLCFLAFQAASAVNPSIMIVRVTDYRTGRDIGTCGSGMPFEMAE